MVQLLLSSGLSIKCIIFRDQSYAGVCSTLDIPLRVHTSSMNDPSVWFPQPQGPLRHKSHSTLSSVT